MSAAQRRKASPAQAISGLAPEALRVELSTTLNSAAVSKRERRLILPVTEVSMNKIMLKFPTGFGEAVKQVFVGGARVASPDLQNFSDKGLEDIGLVRLRTDF